MKAATKIWLRELVAAAISGAATGIAAVGIDPSTFNFGDGLSALGKMMFAGMVVGIMNSLKQSPLPARSIRRMP